jgi:hypothetical protein
MPDRGASKPPQTSWRDDPWLRWVPLAAGLFAAILVLAVIEWLTGSLF